ncbi:oxidoreductase [Sphingobacteriaceae bacterium]|nr:oxidoreductase [Sphingobacteriaceae bacterium]
MPKVPKWAADAMESIFSGKSRQVVVSDITYINPYIKKITFKGDFTNVKFKVGQAIVVRVDDTNFRNYTPSYWNSSEEICEVIFHLHGNGPGSHYIANLKLNDTLRIGLPRGFDFYKKDYKYHFFFGDETTIGFFKSLKNAIDENGQNYIGVLEVNNDSFHSEMNLECMLDVVPISANKAENAIHSLESLDESVWALWKTGVFYLMGNAKSIQNFRKALKEKGISSRNIITQPYWVEGKIGL